MKELVLFKGPNVFVEVSPDRWRILLSPSGRQKLKRSDTKARSEPIGLCAPVFSLSKG
jgi:hypothetical protein